MKRLFQTKTAKIHAVVLLILFLLTIGHATLHHFETYGHAVREWENSAFMVVMICWQAEIILLCVMACRRVFTENVRKSARYLGRGLSISAAVFLILVIALFWIAALLSPDEERRNENGTITVKHSNWLDPSDYSLWEPDGLFYRTYLRDSSGWDDTDPDHPLSVQEKPAPSEPAEKTEAPALSEEISLPEEEAVADTEEMDEISDGYVAIFTAEFSQEESNRYQRTWTAKGEEQAIVYEDEDIVRFLRYDRESKNGECLIYVYYESDNGASVMNAKILDMYAYVKESGEVISSGRTDWADAGNEEYREATGE